MSPAFIGTSDGSSNIPSSKCLSAEIGPSKILLPWPSSTTLSSHESVTFWSINSGIKLLIVETFLPMISWPCKPPAAIVSGIENFQSGKTESTISKPGASQSIQFTIWSSEALGGGVEVTHTPSSGSILGSH